MRLENKIICIHGIWLLIIIDATFDDFGFWGFDYVIYKYIHENIDIKIKVQKRSQEYKFSVFNIIIYDFWLI